jgi:hypothetical protein
MDYPGGPQVIWTRDSILRQWIILSAIYVTCIPLFACCVIAVIQVVYCVSKGSRRRRAQGQGHRQTDP